MRPSLRWTTGGLLSFALLTCTHIAQAFCGFYVDEGGKTLANEATQVVLMRAGTKTVLSMQNDYAGPPENFAMVVPVPVVLKKEQVKTLPKSVLEKVEQLDAPRLVEYWEQDPCAVGEGIGLGNIGTLGHGAGVGTGQGYGAGGGAVKIEAQFVVGEYEIVILSATDSSALEVWLKGNKYHIPDGAEPLLRPYVAAGMKFFVAKVDPQKLTFANGHAALSPLRFAYDAETFSLPVRLGLLNATGKQDLVIHILGRQQRYEAANYANLTMPTNIDVADGTKGKFGSFYATLFDHVTETHPRTLVTEYSWDASSCDPCPGPTLQPEDLTTLGADVILPNGELVAHGTEVKITGSTYGEGLPERVVRMHSANLSACTSAPLAVNLSFTLETSGAVRDLTVSGTTDPKVKSCFTERIGALTFPAPPAKSQVAMTLQVSALHGGGTRGFTLTRLHLRYGKDDLRDDIVFKEAEPIVGGRESMQARADGGVELERGARPDTTNNFQARYVIRHEWPGPITCAKPQRGVWGSAWPDAGTSGRTQTATKLAFADRSVGFASYVTAGGSAELSRQLGSGAVTAPTPSASAAPSAAPSASGGPSAKPAPSSGCGSCAVADEEAPLAPALAVGALVFARLRRRRNPR